MPTLPASMPSILTNGVKVFNQGTVECGCTITIGGSAPNGLEIYNSTNNTRCVLRGLPSSGYLRINSDTGLIQLVSGYGTEHGFTYHDYGYITLAPNNMPEFSATVGHTAGSTQVTFVDARPSIQGKYLYIDGVWRKVNTVLHDRVWAISGSIDTAAVTTNTERVPLGVMNAITVSGAGASLTRFGLTYTPKAL